MRNESRKSMRYRLSCPKALIAFIIDIVGYIIFSPAIFIRKIFHRRSLSPSSILLLRLDHMGDVLMATPAIIALKEKFPSARITVAVKEANKSLISLPKEVHSVVGLDVPWVVKDKKNQWGILLKKIGELRKEKFDFVIDLKGDLRNIILLFLTGSRERVSYGIRGGGFLLTRRVKYTPGIRHEIERNLDIVRNIAGKVERTVPRYDVSAVDEAKFERIFSPQFLPNRKLIGIHPGANSPSKRWPLESFAELAKRIKKDSIGDVLVFVEPDTDIERYFNKRKNFFEQGIIPVFEQRIIPVWKELAVTAIFFKKLDLFIGNDSGPFHLAEAVGTKVITIFGGTYPEIVGPISENSKVIKSKKSCAPCRMPGEKEKCKDAECLKEISVDDVYKVVKEKLGL